MLFKSHNYPQRMLFLFIESAEKTDNKLTHGLTFLLTGPKTKAKKVYGETSK